MAGLENLVGRRYLQGGAALASLEASLFETPVSALRTLGYGLEV